MSREVCSVRSCLFVPVKTAISPAHNGQLVFSHADGPHVACRRLAHRFFTRCQHVASSRNARHGPLGISSVQADCRSPPQRRGGDAERRTDAAAAAVAKNDAVDEWLIMRSVYDNDDTRDHADDDYIYAGCSYHWQVARIVQQPQHLPDTRLVMFDSLDKCRCYVLIFGICTSLMSKWATGWFTESTKTRSVFGLEPSLHRIPFKLGPQALFTLPNFVAIAVHVCGNGTR